MTTMSTDYEEEEYDELFQRLLISETRENSSSGADVLIRQVFEIDQAVAGSFHRIQQFIELKVNRC